MELIRRGKALINSGRQPPHQVLQVESVESGESTPVIELPSGRCFDPVSNDPDGEGDVGDEPVKETGSGTYVEAYLRLLCVVGIIPYNCFEGGQSQKIAATVRRVSCRNST